MNSVTANEDFTNFVLNILFDGCGVEDDDAELHEQVILRKAYKLGLIGYNPETECFERLKEE